MGAFCSKKNPNKQAVSYLHSGHAKRHLKNRKLASESPIELKTGQRPAKNDCIAEIHNRRVEQQVELEDPVSPTKKKLGYRLAHEKETDDIYAQQRFEKRHLSRVLSDKAKSAKSKTSIVAKKGAAKVSEVGYILGRAGTASFEKAVEALDTVGSSITTLGSGFASIGPKGTKIGILAFEVANTIVKGFNLDQSLSDREIMILREEILPSEGVQRLVSKDMHVLWKIAAADKREGLELFTREVGRFGNHCKDPQWHQLSRVFEKLGMEVTIPRQKKEDAEQEIERLMVLAQQTAELYHELHSLDRIQNDLKQKLHQDEDIYNTTQGGETLTVLKSDLKDQQKYVRMLKKRSLWSKILEEVMEKLVDIVYYLHQKVADIFGPAENDQDNFRDGKSLKDVRPSLGSLGLALHYANIINQIDNLVSRPNSVPPNARDTLYQGLPPTIKAGLRGRLQLARNEELTAAQIKGEMEKILDWLAPVAINTTRFHHGFGWVGEWANCGVLVDRRLAGHGDVTKLQTLYHAKQGITEFYILELIVLLNLLVGCVRSNVSGHRSPYKSPSQSPLRKTAIISVLPTAKQSSQGSGQIATCSSKLSQEDQDMLRNVIKCRRRIPGISKSEEFGMHNEAKESERPTNRPSKSNSDSARNCISPAHRCRHMGTPTLSLDIDRLNDINVPNRNDTRTLSLDIDRLNDINVPNRNDTRALYERLV